MQDGGLVDGPIDSPGLDPDDVGCFDALDRRDRGEVGRPLAAVRERQEFAVRGGRSVHVIHPRRQRAKGVHGRVIQVLAISDGEPPLLADRVRSQLAQAEVGLQVGAGNDGAGDRVVDDRDATSAAAHVHLDRVLADSQA